MPSTSALHAGARRTSIAGTHCPSSGGGNRSAAAPYPPPLRHYRSSAACWDAAQESLTYFLHHSYKWVPEVGVYWPIMKAQHFHLYGIAISLAIMVCTAPAQPLVVHEWGTFTSLQDEAGRTLGGINTDDEPVPAFCHDVGWGLVRSEERRVGKEGRSRW